MKKIVIGGSIGAGKSSLAKKLSKKLDIEHIELDALVWLPNWKMRSTEDLKKLAAEKIKKDTWAVCGNFSVLRPIIWKDADTVIWLDYPFHLCFWQTFKRSVRNIIKQQTCCNGNRESWGRLFFSRESVLLWCIRTYKKRNKKYEQAMRDSQYKHIQFVRLKSHKEAGKWVENLDVK